MNTELDLADRLRQYEFYHVIELTDGIVTPGRPNLLPIQAPVLEQIRRYDLREKRVLDIGCRDGLFSFAAEKLGAAVVLGIDNDLSLAATEFLIPYFQSKVRMLQVNLYDLSIPPTEKFDFVIFAGVLYHLRFPHYGLKRIADAMNEGGTLIIETGLMISHDEHPFVYSPSPKESPYDPTSVTFFNHRALVASLNSLGFCDVECRSLLVPSVGRVYPSRDAFLSGPDAGLANSTAIIIGRATYVCRRDPSASDDNEAKRRQLIGDYWFSHHDRHSKWSKSERQLLELFRD